LVAKEFKRDICIVYPNLEKEDVARFQSIVMNPLAALVQGIRIRFMAEPGREIFYKLNIDLYQEIDQLLIEIGIRTRQISALDDYDFLLPTFGDNHRLVKEGIFNKNELGYDFAQPEYEDPEEEQDEEDDDWDDPHIIPGSFVTKTPVKLNPAVVEIMNRSIKTSQPSDLRAPLASPFTLDTPSRINPLSSSNDLNPVQSKGKEREAGPSRVSFDIPTSARSMGSYADSSTAGTPLIRNFGGAPQRPTIEEEASPETQETGSRIHRSLHFPK